VAPGRSLVCSSADTCAVSRTPPSSTPTPRIAVVIPCWNDGATLGEALASLRDQEPCELVVVDDGSTDGDTLAFLAQLEAQGTAVVRQTNSGPAAARMAGVAATSAGYVFALDADDAVRPGALTVLADALDADPDLALAWGDLRTFGDAELTISTAADLDPWWLTYQNPLPSSSLVRRVHLEAAGGWQLQVGYEDWDLWLALAERGCRGRRLPLIAVARRLHDGRRYEADRDRHALILDRLEERHCALFSARRENRRRSRAPRRLRVLLPLVWALPLSLLTKRRAADLLARPGYTLRLQLARRTRA